MQKQVQKLKFWAIVIGILFAFYGCNEIPNDAKEASESKSGLSFYQNPLDYLNDIRTDVGLNTLTADYTLEIAAQNHAKYVVANNEISHDETAGKINFTGITPQDRAFAAGFNSSVIENFSYNAEDMKMAIDSLMSAIYHRFGFLDFHIDSVGIGFADDNKISSYVFEMGNSNVENFCKKGVNENGFGEFVFGFCKDKKLAMQKKNFLQAQDLNFIDYVVYPNNEPALAIFNGEIPDPMPKCKILSTPVSIEFNKNAGNIEMQDFKIFNQNGDELKNTEIIDKNNDINGRFNQFQFAVFSKEIFDFDSTYKAQFDYTQNGEAKRIEWEFKTQTPKNHYFVVNGGENLALLPNMTYDIFVRPSDCNDVFKKFKISYSNMQKPEISGLFGNILRVNLNGAKGAKAEISLDNGKTLKLFLKEKSPNYSDNRIKLGIFAGISGIILVFMIIKRRKNAKTMGRSF